MLTSIHFGRYVIMKDLERKGLLVRKDAGNDLWPRLLHQYSRTGRIDDLPMVYGTFTA